MDRMAEAKAEAQAATTGRPQLAVVVMASGDSDRLSLLLPQLRLELEGLQARYEILVVLGDDATGLCTARDHGARPLAIDPWSYTDGLVAAFNATAADYILTMDADISDPPSFVRDLWRAREGAEVTVASRYCPGGRAHMSGGRRLFSPWVNAAFSRGLSLAVRDMSSGFRIYKGAVVRNHRYVSRGVEILQEALVHAYAEGWRVQEIPFEYRARPRGSSARRMFNVGTAYVRTFARMWRLRNSIATADYDDRAYDGAIWLQRYWQRARFRHVTELAAGEGPVLDVGCGSSRIIGALAAGSVCVDILMTKLRYARKFGKTLVQASGGALPFGDESFSCVVCSQVIEHVPADVPILDELCRVLKTGGRLVLGTPDYSRWEWVLMEKLYGFAAPGAYADEHITRYTRDGLAADFAARGFQVEDVRYVGRGELILALRKR